VQPITATDPEYSFAGIATPAAGYAPPVTDADTLGPLGELPGTWTGKGFNTIWRPHNPPTPQDRFLELTVTNETLVFTEIGGPIPNRGLLMPDIEMFGLTSMQQIADDATGAGLHIEPGVWLNVPPTTDPQLPESVVRMGSIPHGTTIVAQGLAEQSAGPPQIANNDIRPFPIGQPGQPIDFPEAHLDQPTEFRSVSGTVDQGMVDNPNSVLQGALAGQTITVTTALRVTTTSNPVPGGGTANTAFLQDATNPPGGNATAAEVDATFWIETLEDGSLQLQYTQLVQLDFNGLRWPHVTVATLRKQP
jgi:hypothetical protein